MNWVRMILSGMLVSTAVMLKAVAQPCRGPTPESSLTELCQQVSSDEAIKKVCQAVPEEQRIKKCEITPVSFLRLRGKCGGAAMRGLVDSLATTFEQAPAEALQLLQELQDFITEDEKQKQFADRAKENWNYIALLATNEKTRDDFLDRTLGKTQGLYDSLAQYLEYRYATLACLKPEVRMATMCRLVAEMTLPPLSFYKFLEKLKAVSKAKNGIRDLAEAERARELVPGQLTTVASTSDPAAVRTAIRQDQGAGNSLAETPPTSKQGPSEATQLLQTNGYQHEALLQAIETGDVTNVNLRATNYLESSARLLREKGYAVQIKNIEEKVDISFSDLEYTGPRPILYITGAPKDKSVVSGVINSINSAKGTQLANKVVIDPVQDVFNPMGGSFDRVNTVSINSAEILLKPEHRAFSEELLLHEMRHAALLNKTHEGIKHPYGMSFMSGEPNGNGPLKAEDYKVSQMQGYDHFLHTEELSNYGYEMRRELRSLQKERESFFRGSVAGGDQKNFSAKSWTMLIFLRRNSKKNSIPSPMSLKI